MYYTLSEYTEHPRRYGAGTAQQQLLNRVVIEFSVVPIWVFWFLQIPDIDAAKRSQYQCCQSDICISLCMTVLNIVQYICLPC